MAVVENCYQTRVGEVIKLLKCYATVKSKGLAA